MVFTYSALYAWLCAAAGQLLFAGMLVASLTRQRVKPGRIIIAALLPAMIGLLTSRVAYALMQPDQPDSLLPWCFTAGFAGMAGGTALAAVICGTGKLSLLDEMAPWFCGAMAFARLAQRWLMEMGTGVGLEEGALLNRFPFALVDDTWGETVLAVFVLETLCALIAMILCLILRRGKTAGSAPGAGFCRGVSLLLLPQVLLEQFREGHYLSWRLLRLEQVLIAVLVLAALAALCGCLRKTGSVSLLSAWWPVAAFVLAVGVIAVMQFVMDGKLFELPEAVIWILYVAAVLTMIALVELAIHRVAKQAKDVTV